MQWPDAGTPRGVPAKWAPGPRPLSPVSFVGGGGGGIEKVFCSVELGRKGGLTEWDFLWHIEGLPVTWLFSKKWTRAARTGSELPVSECE